MEKIGMVRIVFVACVAVGFLVGIIFMPSLIEQVDADEIVVIQGVTSGNLTWHTTAGLKPQFFGKVTRYPKRNIYEFEKEIRFNDGGEGTMHASVQWEMPLDETNLNSLHSRFGNADAIQTQLVARVADKSLTLTGPLLSSTESYAERRADMIYWVEDQINNGAYRTKQVETTELDAMTGEQRNVIVVELELGPDGQPLRQERGQLTVFGITPFNFTVEGISYGATVEAQIQEQQQNIMRVQTSIAQAREAEQRAITIEQQGRANAAEARAQQEVVRAREVTAAEQALEVATLKRQEADQYRQEQILRGQGDAERRRLTYAADNGLDQRLSAYVEVQKAYAAAIAQYQGAWVPAVVTGGEGVGVAGSGAQQMLDMLGVRAARDLAIDITPPRGRGNGN